MSVASKRSRLVLSLSRLHWNGGWRPPLPLCLVQLLLPRLLLAQAQLPSLPSFLSMEDDESRGSIFFYFFDQESRGSMRVPSILNSGQVVDLVGFHAMPCLQSYLSVSSVIHPFIHASAAKLDATAGNWSHCIPRTTRNSLTPCCASAVQSNPTQSVPEACLLLKS